MKTANKHQSSVLLIPKAVFHLKMLVINTKTRMQLETKRYLKIQNLFEMYGQWKLESQTSARFSKQNLPLDSHSV